jgi:hypothetical protein
MSSYGVVALRQKTKTDELGKLPGGRPTRLLLDPSSKIGGDVLCGWLPRSKCHSASELSSFRSYLRRAASA